MKIEIRILFSSTQSRNSIIIGSCKEAGQAGMEYRFGALYIQ